MDMCSHKPRSPRQRAGNHHDCSNRHHRRQATFWKEIVDYARGEKIEAAIIGSECDYGGPYVPRLRPRFLNVVLTPRRAKELLSYKGGCLNGAVSCHPVYIYTTTRVLFVTQYDGHTTFNSVPRNPMNVKVVMPGDVVTRFPSRSPSYN